jgi:ribonuclease P protein component
VRWYEGLRRSNEIAFVRRRGRLASLGCLSAYALDEPRGRTSVAVSVAKTVGSAVTRNLVRRRIKGALDAQPPAAAPLRLLFVAKPAAASASYERLARDVSLALSRLAASG